MDALVISLGCALAGACVLSAALFSGLLHVCHQRNELAGQLEQVTRESDGLQAESNDKSRRLTRRRQPSVVPTIPQQRGATP